MNLMEIDGDILELPKVEYNIDIELPSNKLLEICENLSIVGDTINIEVVNNNINKDNDLSSKLDKMNISDNKEKEEEEEDFWVIRMICNGDDGSVEISIDTDELNEFSVDEEFKNSYPLKNLNLIGKFYKISDDMTIGLSRTFPMSISYRIDYCKEDNDSGGDDNIEYDSDDSDTVKSCLSVLKFHLAPKIIED